MVAGLATLHELDEAALVERSARVGKLLLERTRPLVERYDVVKDVRGLGLMWAIELGEPEAGEKTTYRLLERMQPVPSRSSSSCRSSPTTASSARWRATG